MKKCIRRKPKLKGSTAGPEAGAQGQPEDESSDVEDVDFEEVK